MSVFLLVTLFLILLLFPIGYALIVYKRHDGEVLKIQQDRTRDPRYFGKSFSTMIKQELSHAGGGKIRLSKDEELLDAGQEDLPDQECDKLVIANQEVFETPPDMTFFKEIYGSQSICIGDNTLLRAVYADKHLIIGSQTEVVRWIDAQGTVAIYDNCDLGISASSASVMSIGKNCSFQRLFAPVVLFGQYPDEELISTTARHGEIYRLKVQRNKRRNISYIKDSMIDKNGVVPFTVISKNDLIVTENLVVQGDIRSSQGIWLCDGAVVCGNLFAEKDVILGKNTCVLGNVFTQGSIKIQDGAVVGRKENTSSVIARDHILIEQRACVFGYVGCEGKGKVWPLLPEENQAREIDMRFLNHPDAIVRVSFETVEAYNGVNELGYRNCHSLKEVVIPEGVTKINRSMFFGCDNLENVVLPSTLQVIDDYAFAECRKLRGIQFEALTLLNRIGAHAFENCHSLRQVVLPRMVETIGNAAFAGCNQLASFRFTNPDHLQRLGTHVWKATLVQKENIHLPKELLADGESLFSDPQEWKELKREEAAERAVEIHLGEFSLYRRLSIARYSKERKRTHAIKVKKYRPVRNRKQMIRRNILIGFASLVSICAITMASTWYYTNWNERMTLESEVIEIKNLYHNQGLLEDIEMDQTPDQVTEQFVIYEDRVLQRYAGTQEQIDKGVELFKRISESIPEPVSQHVMVVPGRIQYEDSAEPYRNGMYEAVSSFYDGIPTKMNRIDLFKALEPYQDRYLFYRTAPNWTAEGAYYGVNTLMASMGKELPELTAYEESMYQSFKGTLWNQVKSADVDAAGLYNDRLYYYLLPQVNQWGMLYSRDDDGEIEKLKSPVISKSRFQVNSFIGGIYSHAILEGIPSNGKTVMLVGDDNMDIAASYFLSEYETVYVVNSNYYKEKARGIQNIFKNYEVSDVVFILGADTLASNDQLALLNKVFLGQ